MTEEKGRRDGRGRRWEQRELVPVRLFKGHNNVWLCIYTVEAVRDRWRFIQHAVVGIATFTDTGDDLQQPMAHADMTGKYRE